MDRRQTGPIRDVDRRCRWTTDGPKAGSAGWAWPLSGAPPPTQLFRNISLCIFSKTLSLVTQVVSIIIFICGFFFLSFCNFSEGFSLERLKMNKLYNIFMIKGSLPGCCVPCWPVGVAVAPLFTSPGDQSIAVSSIIHTGTRRSCTKDETHSNEK